MTSWFWLAFGLVGAQRLAEMAWARRNGRRLAARGARRVRDDGMGLIVATHAAWFAAAAGEWLWAPWAGTGPWTLPGLALFACGQALRHWGMATLGPRWSVRIWVLPGAPLVARGPYRFLRHPIYLGVGLELAGLPIAFGLWGTAAAIALLNGVALARRIGREEGALGLRQEA